MGRRIVALLCLVLLLGVAFAVGCGTDETGHGNGVAGDSDGSAGVGDSGDEGGADGDGDDSGNGSQGDGTGDGVGDGGTGDGDGVTGDGDGTGDGSNGDGDGGGNSVPGTNEVFTVPGGDVIAYSAQAVRGGDYVWLTYLGITEYDDSTAEKIYLARFDIRGSMVGAPVLVGEDTPTRDVHPAIAANEETVYVAWLWEGPEGQQLRARTYDSGTGHALQSEPFLIDPALKDGTLVGTVWKPSLAIMQDGNAVVVAEGLTQIAPRVVLQRFDRDGNLVLNGIFLNESETEGQYDPAVTVLADGTILYAYLRGDFGAGRVFQGVLAPDAIDPGPSPVPAQAAPSIGRSVHFSQGQFGTNWMSYPIGADPGNNIGVRTAEVVGPATLSTTSTSSRASIYSAVADSPTGVALAWMSYLGAPSSGRIHVRGFSATGDTVGALNSVIDLHPTGEPARWPYGPSIVWLEENRYLLFWQERPDNQMTIKATVLEL